MLKLDGKIGEGGGQVLRTSVSLSTALGVPFRLVNIRGGRKRPGMLRQHLTAVRAACKISGGQCAGAELGSTEIEFEPGVTRAGEYQFSVGSAGSAMLVLQTVLPPLLLADGESEITLEGGTHNPWAPPFEAVARSFAPQLERVGAKLDLSLLRHGFYPAGGGKLIARISPAKDPSPLSLLERGESQSKSAEILCAHLPSVVAEQELAALVKQLPWAEETSRVVDCSESPGPGNAINVTLSFANVTEVFTGFGQKGVPAKVVGKRLGRTVNRYLDRKAPVGTHLADQLMVPLAVLAGGEYRAQKLTEHSTTNAEVIRAFLPNAVHLEESGGEALVRVAALDKNRLASQE